MNKSLLTGLLILVILALAWLIIRNPEVTVDEPFEQPTSLEDGNASGSMFGFLLEDFNTIHALRWQPRKTMLTFVKFDGTWKVGEGEKPVSGRAGKSPEIQAETARNLPQSGPPGALWPRHSPGGRDGCG